MNIKRWVKLPRAVRHDLEQGRRRPFAPQLEALEARVVLDDNSAGPLGIVARGLHIGDVALTGAGVRIGQVELSRPGKPSFPIGDAVPQFAHRDVDPAGILTGGGPVVANQSIDPHAEMVAGVMVANSGDGNNGGVAPAASLYASAVDLSAATNVQEVYEQFAVALQNVAEQGASVINLSAGAALADGAVPDGNSLLSQYLDWSARVDNTLYVVAGVHGADGFPVPTDDYNGLTVAFTSPNPRTGVYQYVDPLNNTNEDAAGLRTSIDLVAPGRNIWMPTLGQQDYVQGNQANGYVGTSFAAPHVTGAVALLAQAATSDAGRHEVLKAVLMNSADKLQDTEHGELLGMTKTIYHADGGSTWLNSNARDSADNPTGQAIPLDLEMGAGAVDVERAVKQLQGGEHGPGIVPLVGWNYGAIDSPNDVQVYRLGTLLRANSYVAITLTWDRVVHLQDNHGTGRYRPGDSFTVDPLANLDVYLMPEGAERLDQAVWSSVSTDSNVEHIFFRLPSKDDHYEIWVRQNGATGANYALAWWSVNPLMAVSDGGGGNASAGGSGSGTGGGESSGDSGSSSDDDSGSSSGDSDSLPGDGGFGGGIDFLGGPGFVLPGGGAGQTGGGSSGFIDYLPPDISGGTDDSYTPPADGGSDSDYHIFSPPPPSSASGEPAAGSAASTDFVVIKSLFPR